MRFEVGGVDHQLVGLAALRRQGGKDAVEHAHLLQRTKRL
jgi:hypothetical protein